MAEQLRLLPDDAPRRPGRRAAAGRGGPAAHPAPTRRRRCSSRPAPGPARRRRSSGASSRSSTRACRSTTIAAITFTEKAAAELRHRLRERLAESPADPQRRAAVDALDHAPIGTLHAFARRILFEFPVEAGLPPGFGVLDELESQLALDERWEDLLDELLDDADREVAPGLPAAELVQLCDVADVRRDGGPAPRRRGLPGQLGPRRASASRSTPPPVRPPWCDPVLDRRRRARRHAGARPTTARPSCSPSSPAMPRDRPRRRPRHDARRPRGDQEAHRRGRTQSATRRTGAATAAPRPSTRCGPRSARSSTLVDEHLPAWREYRRLVVGAIAGRFVLDGARERAAAGTLEFHDLLVLARRLLASDDRRPRSASTSATGGCCSTSSRTPTRSSSRSPCG